MTSAAFQLDRAYEMAQAMAFKDENRKTIKHSTGRKTTATGRVRIGKLLDETDATVSTHLLAASSVHSGCSESYSFSSSLPQPLLQRDILALATDSSFTSDISMACLYHKQQKLNKKIDLAISRHVRQEQGLNRAIQAHQERAAARFTGGNTAGALLSLKKVYQLQHEHANQLAAIDHLRNLQAELAELDDNDGKESKNKPFSSLSLFSSANVNATRFTNFEQDVENILLNTNKKNKNTVEEVTAGRSDQELLAKLAFLHRVCESTKQQSSFVGMTITLPQE